MHLVVLGPLEARRGDGENHAFPLRERRLLELLAAAEGRPVPVPEIINALWGDNPPKSADNQVQGCCSRIRRAFPDDGSVVVHTAGAYRLGDGVHVDLEDFRAHHRRGQEALTQGRPAEARAEFEAALALWRDAPFPDAAPGTRAAGLAVQLERTHLALCETYWELVGTTEPSRAVAELERLVALNPLRENAWSALMTVLAGADRRAEALETFSRLRRTLRDELGVHPSQEILALHTRILRGETGPNAGDPGADDQPRGHLPPPVPIFVGRTWHLDQMERALSSSTARVVLHGPFGMGKSALAVQGAHRVSSGFPGGVYYVSAHGGRPTEQSAAEVLEDLLAQSGMPRQAVPESLIARQAAWRKALATRRALVVIDDVPGPGFLEQVMPRGAGVALVTSQRAFPGSGGVQHVPVGPLETTDSLALLEAALGSERVTPQEDRARAVAEACGNHPVLLQLVCSKLRANPGWDLARVLDLVESTDLLLPHLAASGLDLGSGIEMLLADLPPLARTTFDLLPLLDEDSFPGWAVGALTGTRQWFTVVEALVEANLLVEVGSAAPGYARYTLQTLTRAVARDRASRLDPEVVRTATRRLVSTWWALAHQASASLPPSLHDPLLLDPAADERVPAPATDLNAGTLRSLQDPRTWMRTERHGLAGAVELAAEQGWPELAASLTGAMLPFHDYEWLHTDWGRTTEVSLAALERVPEAERTAGMRIARARMIRARAHLQLYRTRHEAGEMLARQALELFTAEDDHRGVCLARLHLVTAARELNRPEEALEHAEAVAASTVPRIRAAGLSVAGGLHVAAGRHEEALESYEEAIVEAARGEDDHRLGLALRGRGQTLALLGRVDEGAADLQRAVGLLQEIDDPGCVARALRDLVDLYAAQGDQEAERSAQERSEAFYASVGRPGTRGPYDATAPRLWTPGERIDER
ncbi:AfsR/SARP family transcriptional regulator [Kytococcus sp. Marseille-QA3725]